MANGVFRISTDNLNIGDDITFKKPVFHLKAVFSSGDIIEIESINKIIVLDATNPIRAMIDGSSAEIIGVSPLSYVGYNQDAAGLEFVGKSATYRLGEYVPVDITVNLYPYFTGDEPDGIHYVDITAFEIGGTTGGGNE